MLTLAQLTTPVTRAEVERSIYDVLGIVGVNTTSWKPGAVVRTMIVGCAIILSAFSELSALIARSGWLELAEKDWLTLAAWYVFRVERIDATFAAGELVLTNTAGGVYTIDADDLIARNPSTNAQYRNVATFTLGSGATLTIPIRAIEAGSSSTSAPATITELVTTLTGVTCTNPAALVGRDQETDPELRTRCYEKLGSLSPFGPWDAYAYAARSATRPDGSYIGVTRVRSVKDGYGNVTTYVATPTGPLTGSVSDPASDLGIVNEAIQTKAEPLAVTAWVVNATPLTIPITYQVWIYNTSGLTNAQLAEQIQTRLTAFMSTQPIGGNVIGSAGGKIYNDAIRTVIEATRPEIFHAVVNVPIGDQAVAQSEVPMLGTVTAQNIFQVDPPQGGLS